MKQDPNNPTVLEFLKSQRKRMGIPESEAQTFNANMYLFSNAVRGIESDYRLDAKSPTTTAKGVYQFTDDSVITAKNRMKNMGIDQKYIDAMPQDPRQWNDEQSDMAFYANMFGQTGSDNFLKKIAKGDSGAMKEAYYKFHHTNPDKKTIARTDKFINADTITAANNMIGVNPMMGAMGGMGAAMGSGGTEGAEETGLPKMIPNINNLQEQKTYADAITPPKGFNPFQGAEQEQVSGEPLLSPEAQSAAEVAGMVGFGEPEEVGQDIEQDVQETNAAVQKLKESRGVGFEDAEPHVQKAFQEFINEREQEGIVDPNYTPKVYLSAHKWIEPLLGNYNPNSSSNGILELLERVHGETLYDANNDVTLSQESLSYFVRQLEEQGFFAENGYLEKLQKYKGFSIPKNLDNETIISALLYQDLSFKHGSWQVENMRYADAQSSANPLGINNPDYIKYITEHKTDDVFTNIKNGLEIHRGYQTGNIPNPMLKPDGSGFEDFTNSQKEEQANKLLTYRLFDGSGKLSEYRRYFKDPSKLGTVEWIVEGIGKSMARAFNMFGLEYEPIEFGDDPELGAGWEIAGYTIPTVATALFTRGFGGGALMTTGVAGMTDALVQMATPREENLFNLLSYAGEERGFSSLVPDNLFGDIIAPVASVLDDVADSDLIDAFTIKEGNENIHNAIIGSVEGLAVGTSVGVAISATLPWIVKAALVGGSVGSGVVKGIKMSPQAVSKLAKKAQNSFLWTEVETQMYKDAIQEANGRLVNFYAGVPAKDIVKVLKAMAKGLSKVVKLRGQGKKYTSTDFHEVVKQNEIEADNIIKSIKENKYKDVDDIEEAIDNLDKSISEEAKKGNFNVPRPIKKLTKKILEARKELNKVREDLTGESKVVKESEVGEPERGQIYEDALEWLGTSQHARELRQISEGDEDMLDIVNLRYERQGEPILKDMEDVRLRLEDLDGKAKTINDRFMANHGRGVAQNGMDGYRFRSEAEAELKIYEYLERNYEYSDALGAPSKEVDVEINLPKASEPEIQISVAPIDSMNMSQLRKYISDNNIVDADGNLIKGTSKDVLRKKIRNAESAFKQAEKKKEVKVEPVSNKQPLSSPKEFEAEMKEAEAIEADELDELSDVEYVVDDLDDLDDLGDIDADVERFDLDPEFKEDYNDARIEDAEENVILGKGGELAKKQLNQRMSEFIKSRQAYIGALSGGTSKDKKELLAATLRRHFVMLQRALAKMDAINGNATQTGYMARTVLPPKQSSGDSALLDWHRKGLNKGYLSPRNILSLTEKYHIGKDGKEIVAQHARSDKGLQAMIDRFNESPILKTRSIHRPLTLNPLSGQKFFMSFPRLAQIIKDQGNAGLVSGFGTQFAASAGLALKKPRTYFDTLALHALSLGGADVARFRKQVLRIEKAIKKSAVKNESLLRSKGEIIKELRVDHNMPDNKPINLVQRLFIPSADNVDIVRNIEERGVDIDDLKLDEGQEPLMVELFGKEYEVPVFGLTSGGFAAAQQSGKAARKYWMMGVSLNEAMARVVMSGFIDKYTKNFGGNLHTRELLKELISTKIYRGGELEKSVDDLEITEMLRALREWNAGRSAGVFGFNEPQDSWMKTRMGYWLDKKEVPEKPEDWWSEQAVESWNRWQNINSLSPKEFKLTRDKLDMMYDADQGARSRMEELTLQHETDALASAFHELSKNPFTGLFARFGKTSSNTFTMGIEMTPVAGHYFAKHIKNKGRQTPADIFNAYAKQSAFTGALLLAGTIYTLTNKYNKRNPKKEFKEQFSINERGEVVLRTKEPMWKIQEKCMDRFIYNPELLDAMVERHNAIYNLEGDNAINSDEMLEILWQDLKPDKGEATMTYDRAGFVGNCLNVMVRLAWLVGEYSPRYSYEELDELGFWEKLDTEVSKLGLFEHGSSFATDIYKNVTDVLDSEDPIESFLDLMFINRTMLPASGLMTDISRMAGGRETKIQLDPTEESFATLRKTTGFAQLDYRGMAAKVDFFGIPMETDEHDMGTFLLGKKDYETTWYEDVFEDIGIEMRAPNPKLFDNPATDRGDINLRKFTVTTDGFDRKNAYELMNAYLLTLKVQSNYGDYATNIIEEARAYKRSEHFKVRYKKVMAVRLWTNDKIEENKEQWDDAMESRREIRKAFNDIRRDRISQLKQLIRTRDAKKLPAIRWTHQAINDEGVTLYDAIIESQGYSVEARREGAERDKEMKRLEALERIRR